MKRSRAELLAELGDTDPITLTEASKIVLRGVVSVSALRSEIRKGNLAVERIGKNLFTTPAAIREMREKCRVKPSALPDTQIDDTMAISRARLQKAIDDLKRARR